MTSPLFCSLYLTAFVCVCVGLLLGVVAIFLIGASRGRVRGYGHALTAVLFSMATLLGLFVISFMVRGSEWHSGRSGPSPAVEVDGSLGRGKGAVDHGPNCHEMDAATSMGADMYKSRALGPIAERGDLTTHEQMHLVDIVIDDLSADMYRKEVLIRLARNPALTAEGRAYLIENLNRISTDLYRTEVLEALQRSSPSKTK